MESEEDSNQRLKNLRKITELNESGFAGIDRNGNIVDRRIHPEAIPVQENPLFNVAKPRKVIQDLKDDEADYFPI